MFAGTLVPIDTPLYARELSATKGKYMTRVCGLVFVEAEVKASKLDADNSQSCEGSNRLLFAPRGR